MAQPHEIVVAHALRSTPGLADALDAFLLKYAENISYPSQQDIIKEGLQLIVRQRVITELENMRIALQNLKEGKDG